MALAKEIGATAGAGAGAPNPGGGANGLTVLEGYDVRFRVEVAISDNVLCL